MAHRLTINRDQKQVQFGTKLTSVPLPPGLPPIDALYDELMHYANVLLGRIDPPVESPYLGAMEVAVAYYSRACEIEMMIFDGEQNESILKGSEYYRFRTGQLRSFKEMSKMMADLGSRRLTQEQIVSAQRYDIGESRR